MFLPHETAFLAQERSHARGPGFPHDPLCPCPGALIHFAQLVPDLGGLFVVLILDHYSLTRGFELFARGHAGRLF